MGHLVNPITFRVGYIVFWKSIWNVYKKHTYINIFKKDLLTFKYINWYIKEVENTRSIYIDNFNKKQQQQINKLKMKIRFIRGLLIKKYKMLKKKMHDIQYIKKKELSYSKRKKIVLIYLNILDYKTDLKYYILKYKYIILNIMKKKKTWMTPFMFDHFNHYKIYRTLNSFVLNIYFQLKKNSTTPMYYGRWQQKTYNNIIEAIHLLRIIRPQTNYHKKYVKEHRKRLLFLLKKTQYFFLKKRLRQRHFLSRKFFRMLYLEFYNKLTKKLFFLHLSRINEFKSINFHINLFRTEIPFINPKIIGNYIISALKHTSRLNWILKPVVKDLKERIDKKKIGGFKILCSGKFTRKQRATHSWQKDGRIPLSTIYADVDYFNSITHLKYGTCSIKVWLFKNLKRSYQYKKTPLYKNILNNFERKKNLYISNKGVFIKLHKFFFSKYKLYYSFSYKYKLYFSHKIRVFLRKSIRFLVFFYILKKKLVRKGVKKRKRFFRSLNNIYFMHLLKIKFKLLYNNSGFYYIYPIVNKYKKAKIYKIK